MAEEKGEGKVLSPPVTVTDEYLSEILRVQKQILEELRKKPVAVPQDTTQVKEPAKRGR